MHRLVMIAGISGALLSVNVLRAEDVEKAAAAAAASLRNPDRETRIKAFESLTNLGPVAPGFVDAIKRFVDMEALALVDDFPMGTPDEVDSLASLKHEDDVSLDRIKGRYEDFVGYGDKFVICGILRNSSYYNFGFRDEAKSYYAFRFVELTKDGRKDETETADIYAMKGLADGLSEFVTRAKEKGDRLAVVRIQGSIDTSRFEGHEDQPLSHLVVSDWQYYDPGKMAWRTWSRRPIEDGLNALGKIGAPAIPALLDYVGSDPMMGSLRVDTLLRLKATDALEGMNDRDKLEALAQIAKRGPKLTSERATGFMSSAITEIARGIKEVPPPVKKAIDPGKRAATLLVMAKNLEKLKKTDVALKAYQEIAEKYPDTAAAKEAVERAKVLSEAKGK